MSNLSNERLEQIAYGSVRQSADEGVWMARELLALREAGKELEASLKASESRLHEVAVACANAEYKQASCPLAVKLPPHKTADDYADGEYTNEDLAAIYNVTRLECSVRIKNAGDSRSTKAGMK